MLGELKLEIIFTSQIASCILGSSVPAATPVYLQTAATFEDKNSYIAMQPQIDYRMVVNSECVNYILACFRPSQYDIIANPVITLIAPVSAGHTGVYQAIIDNQIAAGLPYTFHNSKFFIRNGQRVSRMGFKVDDTPLEPRTNQEMYIDNLRHTGENIYQG
jgi:hypothetical protein